MKTLVSQSIGRKLISTVMVTTATAIVLSCIAFGAADLIDEFRDLDRDQVTMGDVIGSHAVAALTFGDHNAASASLNTLRKTESVEAAAIYTEQGVLFASYSRGTGLDVPAVPGRDGVAFRDGHIESFRPIIFDGDRLGTIYVASNLRELFARLRNYAFISMGILLVTLIVAYVVLSQLQRIFTQPIAALARVARRVSEEKDYTLRAASPAGTDSHEIGDLVGGFNDMLVEIERRDDKLLLNQTDLEEQVVLRTLELTLARNEAQKIAEIHAQLSRQSALILNTVADGLMGTDAAGNVTFVNPAATRILGRTVADFEGREIHDVIHSRYADGSPFAFKDCPMSDSLRRGRAIELAPDTFWRADGSSFPVEFSAIPMRDEQSRVVGAVVTFRDIAERRAMETMKDEFVSTVSHELRTPLTSIRGALGLLSSGRLGPIPEKGQRMLEIAVTNTDRLVRLINDILDLERIGSGKIELILGDADAGALMTQTVEGVQSMADNAGVRLAVDPVATTLSVDSDRILQTLTNLLSNAIKFSSSGTTVTVSGRATGSTFTFRVADQGRGVPAEKLENIFERFQQVDASDSRDKGGSGLGLAICRSIVNAHRGRIWAEQNPTGGTVFQFTIPMEQNTASVEPAHFLKRRTLLVCREDGSAMPQFVETLENHGFQVVCAPTAEMPSRAAALEPDAIVIDLANNRGDGWEIVNALKANPGTRGLPVIVTAALSEETFASYAARIASWLQKPLAGTDMPHLMVGAEPAILLVEDDIDLAGVMTAALQSRGIRTIHATTGREALLLCAEHQPTVIVLDLGLPDIDGFAVVTSLRTQKALRNTPLLIYSAAEVGSIDQARLELGPTEFFTKSRVSVQDLTAQVVRMLDVVTPAEETTHAA